MCVGGSSSKCVGNGWQIRIASIVNFRLLSQLILYVLINFFSLNTNFKIHLIFSKKYFELFHVSLNLTESFPHSNSIEYILIL